MFLLFHCQCVLRLYIHYHIKRFFTDFWMKILKTRLWSGVKAEASRVQAPYLHSCLCFFFSCHLCIWRNSNNFYSSLSGCLSLLLMQRTWSALAFRIPGSIRELDLIRYWICLSFDVGKSCDCWNTYFVPSKSWPRCELKSREKLCLGNTL